MRDDRLIELVEEPFGSEDVFQELLERHPKLIPSALSHRDEPRRWLCLSREHGISDCDAGAPRWSIDHLFIDQDAVPTLIEVKRCSDSRIRREVIGQMLEYAANVTLFSKADRIRADFETSCRKRGFDPAVEIETLIGNCNSEAFWAKAETNLRARNIRIIFVSDRISPELHRIVEFMNEQMNPAQVLAVEIKQFTGEGVQTLVPRILGETAQAEEKRRVSKGETVWTEGSFLELMKDKNPACIPVAENFLRWGKEKELDIIWSTGSVEGIFYLSTDPNRVTLFGMHSSGQVELFFEGMNKIPPFDDQQKGREFVAKLRKEISLGETTELEGYPRISAVNLRDRTTMETFMRAYDDAITAI